MSIIAGCYERFLFGFTYPYGELDNASKRGLTRTFTHAAHKGIVKSLATAGPFVASGGTDDLIHLYDLKDDKDLGFLMNPAEGSITSLQFFVPISSFLPTHLLAGCSDGTLSIWKAGGGWECMKTLRGHRKDITGIAIHPSGCLALTTSADKTLRLWDLVKGRTTFCTKLEKESEGVAFSPNGVMYALQCGAEVVIRPVASGIDSHDSGDGDRGGKDGMQRGTSNSVSGIIKLEHSHRIQSMLFTGREYGAVITGTEDGSIRIWDAQTGNNLISISRAHATRIKALSVLFCTEESKKNIPRLLASASSDGIIKVWDMGDGHPCQSDGSVDAKHVCIGEANTKARLTVMCAVDPVEVMVKKMKESQKERQQMKQAEKKRKKGVQKSGGVPKEIGRKKEKKGQPEDVENKKEIEEGGVIVEGGVVSFIDERDREKEKKKQKRVQAKAKRVASNQGGQKRRAQVLGSL